MGRWVRWEGSRSGASKQAQAQAQAQDETEGPGRGGAGSGRRQRLGPLGAHTVHKDRHTTIRAPRCGKRPALALYGEAGVENSSHEDSREPPTDQGTMNRDQPVFPADIGKDSYRDETNRPGCAYYIVRVCGSWTEPGKTWSYPLLDGEGKSEARRNADHGFQLGHRIARMLLRRARQRQRRPGRL